MKRNADCGFLQCLHEGLTLVLTITREEMDRALDIIEACLREVEQGA